MSTRGKGNLLYFNTEGAIGVGSATDCTGGRGAGGLKVGVVFSEGLGGNS